MLLEVQVGLSALLASAAFIKGMPVPLALGCSILTGRSLPVMRCMLCWHQWVLEHAGTLYAGSMLQPAHAMK